MTNPEIKRQIESSLNSFKDKSLSANALNLFKTLGYDTSRQLPLTKHDYAEFKATYDPEARLNEGNAKASEWEYVDLLFQLSEEEMRAGDSLFEKKVVSKDDGSKIAIYSYLFFVIELADKSYSRTELSRITREVNKLFPMPVMVLFKHGKTLSFAIINRRLHKRDEGKDVLEKVTLIKDINLEAPHRAHIEILFDLSFNELLRKHKFTNFVELHNAWQKTLDTKELNKRFYQELSNWYFWAKEKVRFPDDVEKDQENRNATSLIRLITRIIFIWFIKEKGLVPDILFNQIELEKILKEFNSGENSNSYYRAILQNLFFGTLNQKMDDRAFVVEGKYPENRNEYGVKNLFRYADLFAINKEQVLALFKDVPFLNGGLFDCLDKPDEEGKVIYVDGFSRNEKKQAIVPDYLFFSKEREIDLNEIYDTKNKKYPVKGLVDILTGYKFTITENTPIEEEVALDPELLGKVFENLLASYNPETKTTARKQTGSFYTPREIVNYMVDESLKAYLKNQLSEKGGMKEEDLDLALAFLFEYNEKEHLFNEEQVNLLINAIDSAKILDPACGSGAFPMGILHKLVHILHKLDPNNQKWEERQLERAQEIEDPAIREHLIEDIKAAFTNNELDYGRKLYLIENCIYGVDIQAIAVQIAKLRFFISLVVDQKKQPGKENLGIRALPNLETKFVAANTLIGLEKPDQFLMHNPEIDRLEGELKNLRHQYFSARTRKEKLACQKKDRELRKKISELLVKDGWGHETAHLIAAFDPYDQNASAPFFDPEWMFGVKGGFDVVIGNPPYIDSEAMVNIGQQTLREYITKNYLYAKGNWDIYIAFFEKSLNLLDSSSSCLIFITPDKWITKPFGLALRKAISSIIYSICFTGRDVFESVNVDSIVTLILNKPCETISIFKNIDYQFENKGEYLKTFLDESFSYDWLLSENIEVLSKIMDNKKRLDDFSVCENACSTSDAYKLKSLIDDLGSNLLSDTTDYLKIINTGTIGKYQSKWGLNKMTYLGDKYLKPVVLKKVFLNKFPNTYGAKSIIPKLIIKGLTLLDVCIDEKGCIIPGKTTLICTSNNIPTLKSILAFLNSKLPIFYIKEKYSSYSYNGGINFTKEMINSLPIPFSFENEQEKLSIISDYIIYLKKRDIDSLIFENSINSIIYELYFPDEIKAADCQVLKHLTGLPELKENWSEEEKLQTIEQVYQELSRPEHPVSLAMKKMREEVKEVRIIEGLEK